MQTTTLRSSLSCKVFVACGLWLIALGIYFIFLRPALLPEDPRFMGSSLDTMRATIPGLARWLNLVFNVRGGFMVAAGAMTVLVARNMVAMRIPETLLVFAIAGVSSVALMSATNFRLHSDFRWLLLVPALLWFAGVLFYMWESTKWRSNIERRYFRDQAFHFQTLRTVNNICAEGADTGEVLQTISNIREGNAEDWFTAWELTASRLIERAGHIHDPCSRGQALLRAHNYLRTAEFFYRRPTPGGQLLFSAMSRLLSLALICLVLSASARKYPTKPVTSKPSFTLARRQIRQIRKNHYLCFAAALIPLWKSCISFWSLLRTGVDFQC